MFSPERENYAPAWPRLDGTEGALEMFYVYAFPPEFPGHWVVRRHFVLPDGGELADVLPRLATHLETARELIPPGLYRQERHAGDDDPHVLEAWF